MLTEKALVDILAFNKVSLSYLGIQKGGTTRGAHAPRWPSIFNSVLRYFSVNFEFRPGHQFALSPSLRSQIMLFPWS